MLADRGGVGAALAARLAQARRQGRSGLCRHANSASAATASFECAPDADSFAKLLEALAPAGVARIVHLWPLDGADARRFGRRDRRGAEARLGSADRAGQGRRDRGAAGADRGRHARRGGVGKDVAHGEQSVLHAGIAGVARTIGNEFPDFKPLVIDLDPADRSADALAAELLGAAGETEIALRGGRRFGLRLERVPEEALPKRRIAWDARRSAAPNSA